MEMLNICNYHWKPPGYLFFRSHNTTLDTSNNQVFVKYLYKPNLPDLGENYSCASKRTHPLQIRISLSGQPEIAAEMDKYIQLQIDNGN